MAKFKGNDVLDVSFFEEDLDAFDDQIVKTEDLYEEVHDVYMQATSGEGSTFKMMRDVSELAKTLSAIRSTSIDAINKRFQMKKSVSEIEQKKMQLNKENENAAEIARATIMAIRNSIDNSNIKPSTTSEESKEKFNDRIKNAVINNELNLTSNDKAMKYDFKGSEIGFRKKDSKFIAILKNGEVVDDYPQERVLDRNIIKEEDGYVITTTGHRYRII